MSGARHLARASRRRAGRDTVVVGVGLVALATGLVLLLAPSAPIAARSGSVLGPVATAAPVVVAPEVGGEWGGPAVPAPVPTGFVPERLVVDALDVDSPLLVTLVDADGALVPPADPEELGWWRGVRPGAGSGSVVIAGHVDSSRFGRGPLSRLVDLAPGDRAVLSGAQGARAEYVVRGVETFEKQALPAEDLFTADGAERLVLVTCGGEFDRRRGSWDSNIVAVLDRVPSA